MCPISIARGAVCIVRHTRSTVLLLLVVPPHALPETLHDTNLVDFLVGMSYVRSARVHVVIGLKERSAVRGVPWRELAAVLSHDSVHCSAGTTSPSRKYKMHSYSILLYKMTFMFRMRVV